MAKKSDNKEEKPKQPQRITEEEWYGDTYECPSCGKKNMGKANYCNNCRQKLTYPRKKKP